MNEIVKHTLAKSRCSAKSCWIEPWACTERYKLHWGVRKNDCAFHTRGDFAQATHVLGWRTCAEPKLKNHAAHSNHSTFTVSMNIAGMDMVTMEPKEWHASVENVLEKRSAMVTFM